MWRNLLVTISFLILSGCGTFSITKEELARQLTENQTRQERFNVLPGGLASIFFSSTYPSNGIEKILCTTSSGEKVYLYSGKDTYLEVTSKSTGEVYKLYLDTVFLVDNKLIGLRSRLIQSLKAEIALDDISKAQLYGELPRTEKAENR